MEKSKIIEKVLRCLDEVGVTSTLSPTIDYPMEQFLDESGRQVLHSAPIFAVGNFNDFSKTAIVNSNDGTGKVLLPKDFIKLVAFRMKGWKRDATRLYDIYDSIYYRQSNKYLRGNSLNPVVIRDNNFLRYYSLPLNSIHTIERAEAVVNIPIGSEYPEILTDSLAWLTASKILDVLSENSQAEMARGEYTQTMNILKVS
ncbi:MAG: hypothetical protein IMY73_01740 [Bacteroidetes bacterium]|nr:hypothetical protein [Bacteroidota bacterium]